MADHTVTYRLIVKEIATKYGIYATFMPKPLFGENGSGMHTHQSLFTNGKNAFYDAERPVAPVAHGQGLHRRPAPPRARDLRDLRPVGQLLQAARPGLRGAGLRRLVAAQPLGADPHPALPAGQGAGDPRRDPLSRSRLQPVPDVRGAAPGGPRGDREGLRAAAADGGEPLRPDATRSGASAASSACPSRSARRSTSSRSPSSASGSSARTSSSATCRSRSKEWDEYRLQVTPWELDALPVRPLGAGGNPVGAGHVPPLRGAQSAALDAQGDDAARLVDVVDLGREHDAAAAQRQPAPHGQAVAVASSTRPTTGRARPRRGSRRRCEGRSGRAGRRSRPGA